jgi:hypothetical protein
MTTCMIRLAAKRVRDMIDGDKRKRRNGTKGEPRRIWYARWRAVRFAHHFGCGQISVVTIVASADCDRFYKYDLRGMFLSHGAEIGNHERIAHKVVEHA